MAFDFEGYFGLDSGVVVEQISGVVEYEECTNYYTDEDFRARGVDPLHPTPAKPGTEAKVLMLAARYAAGLPLWHDKDCNDHGPNVEQHA